MQSKRADCLFCCQRLFPVLKPEAVSAFSLSFPYSVFYFFIIPNRSSDFHSYFVLLSAGLYSDLSKM